MLYMSLFVSAFLLVTANLFAFLSRKPVGKTIALCVALALGPLFLMFMLPPVALQGLLLIFAVIAWRNSGRGLSAFLGLSCAATLVAYGITGWFVWGSEREMARLRARYPFESMEERVPAPKREARDSPLSAAASVRLDRVEAEIEEDRNGFRHYQLEMLHDHAVSLFINSPGFGVVRMLRPSARGLAVNLRREPVPRQPGPRVPSTWSPGEHVGPPAADLAFLGWMLEGSIEDFVFPRGFGYVKDRRHVAGFVSHRFSQVPSPVDRWKVQNNTNQFSRVPEPATRWNVRTLDLVGLLLHDEPVIYVSDELPRMDELRGAPMRPPDKFEVVGLTALRQGEDLFISRDGEGLRMLGALYSAKQCVACHGGERGDLLGAFSYTLQPDQPGLTSQEESEQPDPTGIWQRTTCN